jgi:hypothetical protein
MSKIPDPCPGQWAFDPMIEKPSSVYIAGPMTGLPAFNYPAFFAEAQRWSDAGWHVENPANGVPLPHWRSYMRRAIGQLIKCECICLLPGWTSSRGAVTEWLIASMLGMDITYHEPPRSWMVPIISTIEICLGPRK